MKSRVEGGRWFWKVAAGQLTDMAVKPNAIQKLQASIMLGFNLSTSVLNNHFVNICTIKQVVSIFQRSCIQFDDKTRKKERDYIQSNRDRRQGVSVSARSEETSGHKIILQEHKFLYRFKNIWYSN
ncbi:hypothetical protein YC2023_014933 [Brassica napus]